MLLTYLKGQPQGWSFLLLHHLTYSSPRKTFFHTQKRAEIARIMVLFSAMMLATGDGETSINCT